MTKGDLVQKNANLLRGFLDLPPEIRLLIYPYLFTAYEHVYCHDRGILEPWTERRKLPWITIRSGRHGVHPSTTGCWPSSNDRYQKEELPNPEILSTCRTIASEATSLLYTSNTLSFINQSKAREYDTYKGRLENVSRNLMKHKSWGSHNRQGIRHSTLAAFLRKIGPHNARHIEQLCIRSNNCDQAARDLGTAAVLAFHHLPKLQGLTLFVARLYVSVYDSPEYYHPYSNSPFWANGLFQPMYRALTDFVDRVHWLRSFEYVRCGQADWEEWGAFAKLMDIECFVTARAIDSNARRGTRWFETYGRFVAKVKGAEEDEAGDGEAEQEQVAWRETGDGLFLPWPRGTYDVPYWYDHEMDT